MKSKKPIKVKIETKIEVNPFSRFDRYKYITAKCELIDGVLIIPDEIDNICELKENKKTILDSIESINLPSGKSLRTGIEKPFSIQFDSFRNCPRLYDENGFFIVDKVLVDYLGNAADVVIPDGIEELNDNCFGRTMQFGTEAKINSVSLPESLKLIGNCAFLCCAKLNSVSLRGNSQLERIGSAAFAGCESLRMFELPISIKSVGRRAFGDNFDYGCPPIVKSDEQFSFVGSVLAECFDVDKVVEVPDGTTIIADAIFQKKNNIETVVLPKSLKTIGNQTFFECKGLKYINIDECISLEYIGESTFEGCCRLNHISVGENIKHIGMNAFRLKGAEVTDVNIPDSFVNRFGGKICCFNYLGIPDENGLLIRDDILLEAYKRSETIHIPEGVKTVLDGSIDFYDCENCQHYSLNYFWNDYDHNFFRDSVVIEFPSSLEQLGRNALLSKDCVSYVLNESYLSQKQKLNNEAILHFFSEHKDVILDDEVYISLYLYHTVKSTMQLEEIYMPYLLKDPDYTVRYFIECLKENGGMPEFVHAAEFTINHRDRISDAIKTELYDLSVESKKKKAVDLIKNMLPEVLCEKDITETEIDPIEEYCKTKYGYKETEEALKKVHISTTTALRKCPVRYKDSNTVVPDIVVKRAILPYLEIDGANPVIVDEAEELAAKFDKESYMTFLYKLTDAAFKKMSRKTKWPDIGNVEKIIHIVGRYGDESILEDLIKEYERRSRQSVAGFEGRHIRQVLKYSELLKGAILLNETDKAAQYCYSNAWLSKYASLRNLSEEECISKYSINCSMSEDEMSLVRAFDLYEKSIMMLMAVMNREYSYPTVIEVPLFSGGISELGKRLLENIRDAYKEGNRVGSYDYQYSPDDLYSMWMNSLSVHEGNVGINFTVGLVVAECAFANNIESGELVFCRDKWEYRNDYSSSTRAVLKIVSDIDKWEAYNKTGYPVFDM